MKLVKCKFVQLALVMVLLSALVVAGHSSAQEDEKIYTDSQFAVMRFNPDGSLDDSFDQDGKVLTNFDATVSEWANAVAIASGKIVVAGTGFNETNGYVFALARYNTDGSLDTSFGQTGKVRTNIEASTGEVIEDVVVADDGKIIAAGWGIKDDKSVFAVARYNPDGSLDTTFAEDGRVLTDFVASSDERAYAMDIDDNGQIVLAGYATIDGARVFALARYYADGTLDGTFQGGSAGDGKVLTDLDWSTDEAATAMVIGNDGKIVVGGTAKSQEFGSAFALARYNADGSLDTGFAEDGHDGYLWTGNVGHETLTDIALPGEGKIVIAGSVLYNGQTMFALMRVNADGRFDETFNQSGGELTGFRRSDHELINAVSIDSTGRIVIAGWALYEGSRAFALARYNTDGSLDGTLIGNGDANGKMLAGFPATSNSEARDMVIDGQGRIILVGAAGTLMDPNP